MSRNSARARPLQRELAPWVPVIAVTANAGGSGKSTTAARLAWALDRGGMRVWFHDGDEGQLHGLLKLRGEQESGAWGKSESWGTHGAAPTRALAWEHDFLCIVTDGPAALTLTLPEPADFAIYVVGATKAVPTLWGDANVLAAVGHAGRVLVLLNETTPDYDLSQALRRVRTGWKTPRVSAVELLPHDVGHHRELRHDAGAREWDTSYLMNREDGVSDVVEEVKLLARYGAVAVAMARRGG